MNIFAGAIHMHSDYSHDGLDSLETLRDTCIARGIRWVGMTDHAEDIIPEVYDEYKKHCAALSDEAVRFIPGLEFRFAGLRGVHLFALDLAEWMRPATLDEFFDHADKHAGLTVLAHPILCRYDIPEVVRERIGAIEVWNTGYNTRFLPDPRAIELYHSLHAHRPEIVATVGLDQHDSRNDREVRIMLSRGDADDPIAALRAGRFTNVGRGMRFDAQATFDDATMRKLFRKRRALDFVNKMHDRAMFALRRIGVDP